MDHGSRVADVGVEGVRGLGLGVRCGKRWVELWWAATRCEGFRPVGGMGVARGRGVLVVLWWEGRRGGGGWIGRGVVCMRGFVVGDRGG